MDLTLQSNQATFPQNSYSAFRCGKAISGRYLARIKSVYLPTRLSPVNMLYICLNGTTANHYLNDNVVISPLVCMPLANTEPLAKSYEISTYIPLDLNFTDSIHITLINEKGDIVQLSSSPIIVVELKPR
jgi:hypothetical protein